MLGRNINHQCLVVITFISSLSAAFECEVLIPHTVHFVYHDWSGSAEGIALPQSYLPEWRESFSSILGNSWNIRMWGAQESRDLVADHFPDFLETYDGYPLPIQRVDAVRYLILSHEGGLYADLDYELLADIEPLLCGTSLAFSLRFDSLDGGVQNSLMASVPGDPFWLDVVKELIFRGRMPLPPKGAHGDYVMITTGPTFVSDMLKSYEEISRIVLLASKDVFPFNWKSYSDITDSAITSITSHVSLDVSGGGFESQNPPSCLQAARVAASVAKSRGAVAIHHFIGAWTAEGPRCTFG